MPKIILLSGFRGSGKDTLGQLIIDNMPHFERQAFADKLKDIIAEKYGFDRNLADIRAEKEMPRSEYGGLSIRELGRKEWLTIKETHPTLFSEGVGATMQRRWDKDPDTRFVVTDFRYRCDFETLVKLFGRDVILTVRIHRPGIQVPDRETEPEEYALEDFDFDLTLENDGTFEDLWRRFSEVVSRNPS